VHDLIGLDLVVNDRHQRVIVEARETLAEVLRDRLALTGTKVSCDAQVCGACTVLVDGAAVSACTYLATDADGRRVRTVEGLARDGQLSPLQQAFIDHAAFQCGFCTPGMLMAATALLEDNQAPSREDVVRGLEGNLCRCTGYVPIVEAVLAAARDGAVNGRLPVGVRSFATKRIATTEAPPAPIGEAVPRRDGWAKVTGSATFTVDVGLPGMAHARILRSPYPHARIRSVRTEAARQYPGVIAVVTAADLSDVRLVYGHAVADHPLIADGVARFAGEPIVGVVAEDAVTAEEAIRLLEVDYEPLPSVMTVDAALAKDAVVLHETPGEQRPHRGFGEDIERDRPNVCSTSRQRWGDIDAAFAAADVVIEGDYHYPMCYAFAMEPYTAVAEWEQGQLTVWTSAQHPYMVRDDLAHCFRVPLSAVRVIVPYVGGGFGSKSYTKIEPLTAALALRAGRPVRLALSVEEAILTTRGDAAKVHIASAFGRDGLLLGRRAEVLLDTGAYAENSPFVGRKAANRIGGPYRIPALDVTCSVVYTNTAPASSFRGFGAPQVTLAGESQMDEAAERLGLDPLELRRRNALEPGERPWPRARGIDADIRGDLDVAAEELGWSVAPKPGRGRAIAISASDAGSEPVTTAVIRVHADGSVTVLCGSTEIGQGSSTVLAQIAAGEMGVPLDQVHLVQSDTAAVSYDRSTGASRTTTLMGLAIQAAAADARAQLLRWAEESFAPDGPTVVESRSGVRVGSAEHDWGAIVRAWFGGASGEVVGRGYLRRAGATEEMPPFWEIGCVGVEVSVDEETGQITVERLVTVGDVGCAINPQLAESQDIGAAIMGLGMATREELIYQDGNLMNGNLFDYRVPRASDIPELRTVLVERGDGVGVYGAKGGGEGALNPVAAAIASATYRASGIRLREAPFTPERVWRALRERDA
jgi:CO/xanthine dehydrogenase Mo-binding subunit/aerobic-type carbon monoxide dehydrogenase small subunit (CoxS/CutS family)